MIFEKFDNGEKKCDIARYLKENKFLAPSSYDDNGILRKNVYKWDYAIARILRNKIYLGHTEYGKRINLSYKSKKVKWMPRDEWKIVENTHEPIIDEELFERVQRKLNLERKTKSQKYEWLLNGLVYCKECGSQMILKVEHTDSHTIKSKKLHCIEGTRRNSKVFCNRKSKGISEEVITKIVLKNIADKMEKITNTNEIENLILRQYKENNTKMYDDTIKKLENQLVKIENNISELYDDYKNELLHEDDYKRFYKNELERKNSTKLNITKLIEHRENRPVLSLEKLKTLTKELTNVDSWSKDTIDDIIYSVEVDIENNVFINYRYDIFEMV